MENSELWTKFFDVLHEDILEKDEFYNQKPLLAHYTSLAVLENILVQNEVWLSNPLLMNDVEEVRFGVFEGSRALRHHTALLDALGSPSRIEKFTTALDNAVSQFDQEHVFDTYVFCLSEYQPDDQDGLLSMWRGYGGNGRGAAIVFDTAKLTPLAETPLILAKVHYGSREERLTSLNAIASRFATVVREANIPDEKVFLAAYALFERVKLFALFAKHHGFREEREWRVAYRVERDTEKLMASMLHYHNGPRGVEPKLRLRFEPIKGVTDDQMSLDRILERIVLGPSSSTALAKKSFQRMLEIIGKPHLKDRVVASGIPFRSL